MKRDSIKVLIIDDDPKVGWIISEGLAGKYDIVTAPNGSEGLQMVTTEKPFLIILDIKMPDISGIDVLKKLNKLEDRPEVVMLSGHDDIHYVVESMQNGAAGFIKKPFDVKEIELEINRIQKLCMLKDKVRQLDSDVKRLSYYDDFIGDSPQIRQVKDLIEQVSTSTLTVLIRGESGTGKEVVARMMHNVSDRSEESFTKVNCAALPRDLLESELFGYEKGGFTGAHKTKPGRFEIANKGTIFLDEIGDIPMELQSKLLQVLEQQEFVRIGGVDTIHVDVRIICATNKNLEDAIAQGRFRDDLFYRLNEITIFLPPLRDRYGDVPLLAQHFISKLNHSFSKETPPLSQQSLDQLSTFQWPGNVRQLENLLKQVVVRGNENIIPDLLRGQSMPMSAPSAASVIPQPAVAGVVALPQATESGPIPVGPELQSLSLKKRVSAAVTREEKALISEVLTRTNWNRRKAAEMLEISYRSLLYKIKEYALNEIK
ncbi:MAG: sigma-54-dependent Fis family transcriptional regulator [candidate division Zixibacteria bacterium]|nr:sigma-54-dependent Fis family transcriptional regulator [candidate division Zixibacteria bacterium]